MADGFPRTTCRGTCVTQSRPAMMLPAVGVDEKKAALYYRVHDGHPFP